MTAIERELRSDLPAFSIVMPTYQRCRSLRRTLEKLAEVDYPHERLELVLVCDGCSDGSAEMVRSLRMPFAIRILEQPNLGPAAARNLALAHARGPYVLFLDDDVLASRRLLAEHARAHAARPDEERVVIGTLLPHAAARSPWVRWELDTVVRQYAAMDAGKYHAGPRQFYTGNASVHLDHVTAAGGFDVDFRRSEDVELAFRLKARGLRFVFSAEASGLHVAERSFGSWFDAAYQYGRNDIVVGLRRGRPDMLGAVAAEFWERNPLSRGLIRVMLRAPGGERALAPPAIVTAWLAQSLGAQRLSHALCSALFNLAYWHGISDELGGPDAASELIELGSRSDQVDWAAVPARFPAVDRETG